MLTTGTLDGNAIDLDGVEDRLTTEDLVRIEVTMPSGNVVRPWRFLASDGQRMVGKTLFI